MGTASGTTTAGVITVFHDVLLTIPFPLRFISTRMPMAIRMTGQKLPIPVEVEPAKVLQQEDHAQADQHKRAHRYARTSAVLLLPPAVLPPELPRPHASSRRRLELVLPNRFRLFKPNGSGARTPIILALAV